MNVQFPIENLKSFIQEQKMILLDNRQFALQEAAEKMTDMVEKRIFEDGKNTAGVTIGTGTKHKDGTNGTRYEKRYSKTRQSEGLQIGFIDFVRTGKLKGSLRVVKTVSGSVRIEFSDMDSAIISHYLDKMKGKTFAATKLEIATAKRNFLLALKGNKLKQIV